MHILTTDSTKIYCDSFDEIFCRLCLPRRLKGHRASSILFECCWIWNFLFVLRASVAGLCVL